MPERQTEAEAALEIELENIARELGGGWRIEQGVMPLITLTPMEANRLKNKMEQAVQTLEAIEQGRVPGPHTQPNHGTRAFVRETLKALSSSSEDDGTAEGRINAVAARMMRKASDEKRRQDPRDFIPPEGMDEYGSLE